jgi:alpha-1,2-mannosyltransferase
VTTQLSSLRARRRLARPLELALFVEIPLLVIGFVLFVVLREHLGPGRVDFPIFRAAGNAVWHGRSPYVTPTPALLASDSHFVYPTPFALPFVPLALLPGQVATGVYFVLSACAIAGALWLVGVRDVRCIGLGLAGLPAVQALALGTIDPWLLLLLAIGWHGRKSARGGIALAVAAAAKLFLWPVLLWLLATRRWRSAIGSGVTLLSIGIVWALLDPSGMRTYPQTVRVLNDVQRPKSDSLQSLAFSLGVHRTEPLVALVSLAAAAAVVCAAQRFDDRRSFAVAVAGALLATPILWLHYLVLLLVPIGLSRPRLGMIWFLPLVFVVAPRPAAGGSVWQILLVLASLSVAAALTSSGRVRRAIRSAAEPRPGVC